MLSSGDCSFADAQLSHDEASLVHSQASIGWANLLYGRFSTEWARIQDGHIAEQHFDGRFFSGPAWTSKVILYIWRALHDLWRLRNSALHGATFTENETTRRARIEPLVRHLYTQTYALAPSDRIMFRKPLDERLKQPLSIIETWLSLIQPAFAAARTDDADDLSHGSDDSSLALLDALDAYAPPG